MPRLSSLADQKPQRHTCRLCAVCCEEYVRQGETETADAGKVVNEGDDQEAHHHRARHDTRDGKE